MPDRVTPPVDPLADELVPCTSCDNGEWYTECCNGAGGCSCRGQILPMGPCNVCGGTGMRPREADPRANAKRIAGYGFIGTGPNYEWSGVQRMGMRW